MVFAKTDIGKARELNQDYYYISQETDEPKVYILADGMGRIIKGGEIASKLAAESTVKYIKSNFENIVKRKRRNLKAY